MDILRNKESAKFNKILNEICINPQNGLSLFHEEYQKCISYAVRKITHSVTLVKEVENDFLIKLWKRCEFIKKVRNPYSWVCVVASNIVKDKLKTTKICCELQENIASKENLLENVVEDDSFYGKIETLPEREQDIIIKKIMWKYTFEEIAEMSSLPLSTVSSIYYRAIKKLKGKNKKN